MGMKIEQVEAYLEKMGLHANLVDEENSVIVLDCETKDYLDPEGDSSVRIIFHIDSEDNMLLIGMPFIYKVTPDSSLNAVLRLCFLASMSMGTGYYLVDVEKKGVHLECRIELGDTDISFSQFNAYFSCLSRKFFYFNWAFEVVMESGNELNAEQLAEGTIANKKLAQIKLSLKDKKQQNKIKGEYMPLYEVTMQTEEGGGEETLH